MVEQRAYRSSHPWISFGLDLRSASWELWLLLGEAVSKCEHLAGVALGPEAAERLMRVYLAKGVQATTAIEGNTLSEEEVAKRIEGNLQLPPSKEYLGIEVDNIVSASNEILKNYLSGTSGQVTPELIKFFNSQALRNLNVESHVIPGQYRTCSVGVVDYRAAPWQDVEFLVSELCDWLAKPWFEGLTSFPSRDRARIESILKGVIAHLYLAWIHPFGDRNGRTSRLVELHILVNAAVPTPAAHLLSNHYNQTRSEYYRQLSYASKSGGDVLPFCSYALKGFVDQLRDQIAFIRAEQLKLFWQQHVHRILSDSQTGRRRKYLALDLAKLKVPVEKSKITEISVRVFREYFEKGEKTLQRDLAELERLNLIHRVENRYRANMEIVSAYMPPIKEERDS